MGDDEMPSVALENPAMTLSGEGMVTRSSEALISCLLPLVGYVDMRSALRDVADCLSHALGIGGVALCNIEVGRTYAIARSENLPDAVVLIPPDGHDFSTPILVNDLKRFGWALEPNELVEQFQTLLVQPVGDQFALVAFSETFREVSPDELALLRAVSQAMDRVLKQSRLSNPEYPLEQPPPVVNPALKSPAVEGLQHLRAGLEAALRATGDAFLVLRSDGRVLFASDTTSREFPAPPHHWSAGSKFSDNWAAFLSGQRRMVEIPVAHPDFALLAQSGKRREVKLPDGRTFLVSVVETEKGSHAIHAANVTAQKVTEQLSEQRLAALEAARDGIALVDHAGRIVSLNPSAAQLMGFSRQTDALGVRWHRRYTEVPDSGKSSMLLRRSSGEGRLHECTLSDTEDGQVLVIRDVTERRAEEDQLQALNAALALAQRREATAQLASGLAHDFNNTLSAILGSASLIALDPSASVEVRGHAERASAAGRAAAKLVNRLLNLGAESTDASLVDLRELVREMPTLIAGNLPSDISLKIELCDAPLFAEAEASEVSQIFLNLALNARDAMQGRVGDIRMRVDVDTPLRAGDAEVGLIRGGQRYAVIAVQDQGEGIPKARIERIFEPYFTTKGEQGSGLGLAIAATKVRAAGGAIRVQSEPDAGTSITIYWPIASESFGTDDSTLGQPDISLVGTTLMVVDDDAHVAEVLRAYLVLLGAEVFVFGSAEEAAVELTENLTQWTALITDYDMPGMSGGDLVGHARNLSRELPVFVVTALARRITDPRLSSDMITGLFAKPTDLRLLATAIRRAVFSTA